MSACNASSVQHNRDLVSLFYIRRACDDLNRLCSDVHLTDDQFVCVRVLLDFLDLSDHDPVQIRIHLLISLYLRSGERHRIGVLLRCHIKIRNICLNP